MWTTDGTTEGTSQIHPDLGALPSGLKTVPGGLVFTAWDPDHGYELWRSDGTAQGTALAQDIATGAFDSRPRSLAVIGHRIFFLADDGFSGYEPWFARTAILLNKPAQAIQDLTSDVRALGLARGLETSLLTKLESAARALSGGLTPDTITALDVFSKHVDVLTPRRIPKGAAAELREFAGEIVGLLEGTR